MAVATPPSERFRAQPGPQRQWISSPADIAIFGGAAGGGKTFALLIEAARESRNPGYRGVIFRRTNPQIMAGGGLWDAAAAMYPKVGAQPSLSRKEYTFPGGGRLAFRHLQYESDIYDWQGAELAFIGWDEITHFTDRQFFYLLSRARTTCGVRPYIRATCNPDAGSWVAEFLAWWIDPETGYPIPERAGVLRWFYRTGDDIHWYDTRAEAEAAHPDLSCDAPPKSVTFVPAKLSDNAVLCSKDPGYRANLMALSWVERARLLDGNWKVTAADGLFRADWFGVPTTPPATWKRRVRAWDFAATEKTDQNDPDYTVGVLMGEDADGRYWVLDVQRVRYSPARVKALMKQKAEEDGKGVRIVIEQEPGASGKFLADDLKKELAGYEVTVDRPDKRTGDKVARASGYSAAVEKGKVRLVAGGWVKAFISEHTQFPYGSHDDQVDATSTAFRHLDRGGFAYASSGRR